MSDYGFVHEGRTFTPNGTPGVPAEDNDARNKAIEAEELARWQGQPDVMLAYYAFPAEEYMNQRTAPRHGRQEFYPLIGVPGTHQATVTTWMGTTLGTITSARVYRHNFGGRFVSLRVRGINGAKYYGRASWDWGSCIKLRKCKG